MSLTGAGSTRVGSARGSALVLVGLVAAVAPACGFVVGYDGYHVADDAGGSAATSARVGSGVGGAGTGGNAGGAAGGVSCGAPGFVLCGADCIDTNSDDANCGACGVTCSTTAPSTAACEAGRCLVTLASAPGDTGALAVDATSVYWTNPVAGTINKVPIAGGTSATLATTTAPGLITTNANSVFWEADANCGCATIRRMGLDGSSPIEVAPSGQIYGLVADATNVYFGTTYVVYRVPAGGGTPVQLAMPNSLISLGIDTTNVYFTYSGSVDSVPKAGGTTTKLAWEQPSAYGIGFTPTHVYWGTGQALMRVPIGGGTWEQVASGWAVTSFVSDSVHAYGAAYDGNLYKVPLAGGTPTIVRSGVPKPPVVDATSIYWLEDGPGTGKVMKLTPK